MISSIRSLINSKFGAIDNSLQRTEVPAAPTAPVTTAPAAATPAVPAPATEVPLDK